MKILGISSSFHDASVALVVDGELVFSSAEERYSLQKHDPSFPKLALQECSKRCSVSLSDIDYVAYHEDPNVKLTRILAHTLSEFPKSLGFFITGTKKIVSDLLWTKQQIFSEIPISPKKIKYIPHHLSHAAYVASVSPFTDCSVLCLDAVGEWTSTSWFSVDKTKGVKGYELKGAISFPESIGLLYSSFTSYLGFKANDAECTVMALAAFGQAKYKEKIFQIVQLENDGTYSIDRSFFNFSTTEELPFSKKFYEIFGPARNFAEALHFSCQDFEREKVSAEQQYYADIAASLQEVLEEVALHLCKKIRVELPSANLCVTGGVAQNSKMIGQIERSGIFSHVFVAPDPGDGGGAAGAALFLAQKYENKTPTRFSPYLGSNLQESHLGILSERLQTESWKHYSPFPGTRKTKKVHVKKFSTETDLCEEVAQELKKGKIVGWVQERAENGPRALGNRSLLVNPAAAESVKRLSANIKKRAPYRPYACSLLEEDAPLFFEKYHKKNYTFFWMSRTEPVKEEQQEKIKYALHIDGSTRPQILRPEQNPRFALLLQKWKYCNGHSALLNTSFNESGMPLVDNGLNAFMQFARTDLDILVIGLELFWKEFEE